MKRSMLIGTVLLAICGALYAQDWPNEDTVLDKARSKFETTTPAPAPAPKEEVKVSVNPDGTVTTTVTTTTVTTTVSGSGEKIVTGGTVVKKEEDESKFTPFVLAVVPGLQFPGDGVYDTALAGGAIGIEVGDVKGAVGGGVFTLVSGDVYGFQGAGTFNVSEGKLFGFQGAGVFNVANGEETGPFQGAGVFNIAGGKMNGFQGAGVFNIAEELNGFQGAGVFNIAGDVNGVQGAGVFNIAKNVNGLQVGLVNIADSVDGIQLGLVSISKDGIGNIQAYWETGDVAYAGVQFGTKNFYTVVLVKQNISDLFVDTKSLGAVLGLGWRALRSEHGKGMYIDVDVSAKQSMDFSGVAWTTVEKRGVWISYPNNAPEAIPHPYLRASVGIPFGPFEVFGGVSCDVEFPSWYSISAADKVGTPMSFKMWDVDVNAFGKFFVGVKIES